MRDLYPGYRQQINDGMSLDADGQPQRRRSSLTTIINHIGAIDKWSKV